MENLREIFIGIIRNVTNFIVASFLRYDEIFHEFQELQNQTMRMANNWNNLPVLLSATYGMDNAILGVTNRLEPLINGNERNEPELYRILDEIFFAVDEIRETLSANGVRPYRANRRRCGS